jgi:hypothetical protein
MLEKARNQVAETVDGWATLFQGRTGKNYFKVGRILRQSNWAEKEPVKKLCERAERVRPRTNTNEDGAGAEYRAKAKPWE